MMTYYTVQITSATGITYYWQHKDKGRGSSGGWTKTFNPGCLFRRRTNAEKRDAKFLDGDYRGAAATHAPTIREATVTLN